MTNAELLAKIKAEIESLKSIEYPCDNSQQATGFFNALDRMTDFLSTLESEKPVPNDLEEAANKFAVFYDQGTCDGIAQDCFIAGAKWQAEKDARDMYMSDNRHFEKVYQLGKKDMKEQMMKDAVEAEIQMRYSGCLCVKTIRAINEDKFKLGDKVKIIIVKED